MDYKVVARKRKSERAKSVFKIIKAEYWTRNIRKDVTEKLLNMISDHISNNKLEFLVLNETLGGDFDRGTKKTLSIEYNFNGRTIKKDFPEKEKAVIP